MDGLAGGKAEIRKADLAMLARIGALHNISGQGALHRRDALWQAQMVSRRSGPLLQGIYEADVPSPLHHMDVEERLVAAFPGTGLTVGPQPMAYRTREVQ